MEKFRVFKDVDGEVSEPKKIGFEHSVGDFVTRGSYDNRYKCVEVIRESEKITYMFKQGKKIVTFDW